MRSSLNWCLGFSRRRGGRLLSPSRRVLPDTSSRLQLADWCLSARFSWSPSFHARRRCAWAGVCCCWRCGFRPSSHQMSQISEAKIKSIAIPTMAFWAVFSIASPSSHPQHQWLVLVAGWTSRTRRLLLWHLPKDPLLTSPIFGIVFAWQIELPAKILQRRFWLRSCSVVLWILGVPYTLP